MEIGQKLRFIRDAQGLRLEDVAEKTAVNPVTLSQYERGTRQVPYVLVDRLLAFYGVDESVFRSDEPWSQVETAKSEYDAALREVVSILHKAERGSRSGGHTKNGASAPGAHGSGTADALDSVPLVNHARAIPGPHAHDLGANAGQLVGARG